MKFIKQSKIYIIYAVQHTLMLVDVLCICKSIKLATFEGTKETEEFFWVSFIALFLTFFPIQHTFSR